MTEELNIPRLSAGCSPRLKLPLEKRGLEPDECFYLEHELQMRGKRDFDLSVDPPPDLAIEVDISRSSLNKLSIYADLGVPELWLYDGESCGCIDFKPMALMPNKMPAPPFPSSTLKEIERFMERFEQLGETGWISCLPCLGEEQYGHLAR